MKQSLAFPLSDYCLKADEHWDRLGDTLLTQGLDGFEILGDVPKTWEPIPQSLLLGYQMQTFYDWLDCYLGYKEECILDFRVKREVAGYFGKGKPEDIICAYRKDLAYGRALKAPYIVFDVSNADEQEIYTFRWSHSDYWVIDAAVEILNELLKGVDPAFTLLLGNDRWPGFTFLEPKKTEYLLSKIQYPKVGIMLDTGRLLSTRWGTKNQSEGIRYIHSLLDKHGELSRSIHGLHFNYVPTSEWIREPRKQPQKSSQEYHPPYWTPELALYLKIHRLDRHSCWSNPECVSLIDRLEPQYLVHVFYHDGRLTRLGALTRQLQAIHKGKEAKNRK